MLLPFGALAHVTLPLMGGLSRLPLILHALPPQGANIPPAQVMTPTYRALKGRARAVLLSEWASDAPTPPDYKHPPLLSPYLFMGLGKFVAQRIHQMRASKSYLTA